MNAFRSLFRPNSRAYLWARSFRMSLIRHLCGFRNVHPTAYLVEPKYISRDLVAAEYSFTNAGCRIGPKVELGPYVMLGPNVTIIGGDHLWDKPGTPIIFSGRPELKRTVVEADAWIGFGAIIIAGVRLGRGSIVAAGAVVTKNIPPYEIWGGVPARKIGDRFSDPADRAAHDAMLTQPPQRGTYCPPMA